MVAFPTRGQKAPQYWDAQLQQYIDEGDAAAAGGDSEPAGAVAAHSADTTAVHGIANTALLETMTGAQAKADAAQAAAVQRANHTGTQTSATISDFTEAVQDAIAALLVGGTNVTLAYNDAGNSLTITAAGAGGAGLDAEGVRDAIGVALIGSGVITVTANDAGDTITISTTATANSTDAALRDRSTHTGTQAMSTITETATGKILTDVERTKLAGVAANATANSSDAALRDRSTHTGTQAASTVTGLAAVATSGAKADVGLGNVDNTSNATERAAAATLTNKRITKRVDAVTTTATYTFNADNFDAAKITALASGLTLANPSGTPTLMQSMVIRIKDTGTSRTIAYGTQWRAVGVVLPTTTVVGKTLYIGALWNSDDSKWDVIAVAQEA